MFIRALHNMHDKLDWSQLDLIQFSLMATYDDKFGGRALSANQYENQSASVGEDAVSTTAYVAVGVRNTQAEEDVVPLASPQHISEENEDLHSARLVVIVGWGCFAGVQWRAYGSLAVLAFINLLNYMDRFAIAGNNWLYTVFSQIVRTLFDNKKIGCPHY